jgi:hypothetical protein
VSRLAVAGVSAIGVALLAGLVLGMIGYSRLGPGATAFDAGLQAALLLFVTVVIATIAARAVQSSRRWSTPVVLEQSKRRSKRARVGRVSRMRP